MKRIPGVGALHGKPREETVDGLAFTVVPLYHPAAMLYRPHLRKELEQDFLAMEPLLRNRPGAKTLLDYA
jgi:DNA polymerase